jgi:TonB family protein
LEYVAGIAVMAFTMSFFTSFSARRVRVAPLCAALALALVLGSCGDSAKGEIKDIKEQVQRAYGNKDFHKQLALSQKGLAISREALGDKAPDTLYFVQSISESYTALRNDRAAMKALRQELDMRSAAGQPEKKLQVRRALLIKLAEDEGDTRIAGEQAVMIAKGIEMGPGKDPQPVYTAPLTAQIRGGGDVEISYSLDAAGAVTSATVVKSDPPKVFDQVALDTFKKWRFTPMLDQGGRPVSASGFKFTMMLRERPR